MCFYLIAFIGVSLAVDVGRIMDSGGTLYNKNCHLDTVLCCSEAKGGREGKKHPEFVT